MHCIPLYVNDKVAKSNFESTKLIRSMLTQQLNVAIFSDQQFNQMIRSSVQLSFPYIKLSELKFWTKKLLFQMRSKDLSKKRFYFFRTLTEQRTGIYIDTHFTKRVKGQLWIDWAGHSKRFQLERSWIRKTKQKTY